MGVIAQLAERFPCKEEDVGSNPIGSTILSLGVMAAHLVLSQRIQVRVLKGQQIPRHIGEKMVR